MSEKRILRASEKDADWLNDEIHRPVETKRIEVFGVCESCDARVVLSYAAGTGHPAWPFTCPVCREFVDAEPLQKTEVARPTRDVRRTT